jgi:Xaa-Pro aminopeptidase
VTFPERIEALRARLEEPLLVTNLVNVRYLTGFDTSNAALLVDPDGTTRLHTDSRYIEVAEQVAGVEAVLTKRSLLRDLAGRLGKRIAFEADALPFSQHEVLATGRRTLVPTSGLVEGLRAVKDEGELTRVRRAARAAERAFEALSAETWIGRSERELAWRLHQLMHAHGVDAPSFDIAIATGANGSKPHAEPGDAIVEARTLVVADWGARLDGYCSDCTRTLATGDLPRELRRAYDVCLEAQLAAVEGIRPGMTGADADRIARAVIEEAGLGERFGHGLGHGVGLEIHEAPRLAAESQDVLEPGNVVTIEPGVYLPGLGGVRIEDLAIVREDGVEVLNSFPKALTLVG